jgi:hypothetical protein
MNDKLKLYAELKEQQKDIEKRIDELSPIIRDHMITQVLDKLPTDAGTFSIANKTTWKYTDAVLNLQKEEKAKGIAKQVITNYLRFSSPKDENKDEKEN